jgi:hypothetical protein
MERITYRKTLDVHKNGVQFLLQGFETADKLSRVIEISLMASGDAIDFPLEDVVVMMYVTTENAKEPSIHPCTIKDNKVVYEVLPITEEGITEMQMKIIETDKDGVTSVLAAPKFAVEVTNSNTNDDGEELKASFTAIEEFIAKAETAYGKRLERIELDSECIFKAYYADGTYYENSLLKELFTEGNVLLSESFAHGGTGVRAGEDTDNSKYYSNVAKSEAQNAKSIMENSEDILQEVKLHGVYTAFSIDFESGEVVYVSPSFNFKLNTESGELEAEGQNYTFNDDAGKFVEEWLIANGVVLTDFQKVATEHITDIEFLKNRITPIEKGGTGTDNVLDARTNLDVYSKDEVSTKSTLGLFGLSADNKPNTILKMLGSHWWRRRNEESGYALSNEGTVDATFSIPNSRTTLYYSDTLTVSEEGIYLDNPQTISVNLFNQEESNLDVLRGKYFSDRGRGLGVDTVDPFIEVFKTDEKDIRMINTFEKDRYVGKISNITRYVSKYYEINGEWEYIYSENKDEYPEGKDGMFYYEYLGVPYANAIVSSKATEDIINALIGGDK